MKRASILFFLLAFSINVMAQEKKEEMKGNVCYTESVTAQKGTSFPVKVFVHNVDTLVAFSVPIYYRSEDVDLKCDSVTFHGSRAEHFSMSFFKIEPVGKVVFFTFLWVTDPEQIVPPMPPGDGLVAELWFTAGKDIKSGKVELASGPNAFLPHPYVSYGYEFTDPRATKLDFEYVPGYITVK